MGHRNGCILQLLRSKIPPACVLRIIGGREMYSVDIYNRVRRACLKDGMWRHRKVCSLSNAKEEQLANGVS